MLNLGLVDRATGRLTAAGWTAVVLGVALPLAISVTLAALSRQFGRGVAALLGGKS